MKCSVPQLTLRRTRYWSFGRNLKELSGSALANRTLPAFKSIVTYNSDNTSHLLVCNQNPRLIGLRVFRYLKTISIPSLKRYGRIIKLTVWWLKTYFDHQNFKQVLHRRCTKSVRQGANSRSDSTRWLGNINWSVCRRQKTFSLISYEEGNCLFQLSKFIYRLTVKVQRNALLNLELKSIQG
jgi:hypothetical protein